MMMPWPTGWSKMAAMTTSNVQLLRQKPVINASISSALGIFCDALGQSKIDLSWRSNQGSIGEHLIRKRGHSNIIGVHFIYCEVGRIQHHSTSSFRSGIVPPNVSMLWTEVCRKMERKMIADAKADLFKKQDQTSGYVFSCDSGSNGKDLVAWDEVMLDISRLCSFWILLEAKAAEAARGLGVSWGLDHWSSLQSIEAHWISKVATAAIYTVYYIVSRV